MKKRIPVFLLSLWLLLALSGCSITGLDSRSLMAPPKTNADQQAIYALLRGSRSDLTFVYPRGGEYRSAIIMQDFTGDGVKDAIGFYALEDSGGVAVQFLVKADGEWHTDAVFSNTALQVDRVCFGDLTGDGVSDIVIGWGSTGGATGRTASVTMYHYDGGGSMQESPMSTYGEMILTDMDSDGVCEIFTVNKFLPAEAEGDASYPAQASLYRWTGSSMAVTAVTDADNSIASYSSISFGLLGEDLAGVALDGAKADGSMTTQLFIMENGYLLNVPRKVNTEEYSNPFSRPSGASFLCRDINGDGILEIPSVSLLPGIPDATVPDSTSYLVTWNAFEPGGSFSPVTRGLTNLAEGYWFSLPWALNGQITAVNDPERRSVTYTQVVGPGEDGSPQFLSQPLFSIRVFTRTAWESMGESGGYELLDSQEDSFYGILVRTQEESMALSIERIKKSFRLLN